MKAKDEAAGKWPDVLAALGVSGDVLDGKHHPCPKDGTGSDRFRFADRNGSGNYFCACSDGTKGGMSLLMCCRDWDYATTAKEVERVAGTARPVERKDAPDPRIRLRKIQRSATLAGAEVVAYLAGRGLETPGTLRQARQAYYSGAEKVGMYDAMVAKVVDAAGHPLTYHLTYLQDGKKAPLDPARKMMTPVGNTNGAAIRLYALADHIGIAEGIETAIAAHQIFKLPVWSVMNKNGVRSFEPPTTVRRVSIFADRDPTFAGQAAAYACAERLMKRGIPCDVRLPMQDGDWNDELTRMGKAA